MSATAMAGALITAEINSQIATARAYPRSIQTSVQSILTLATLDRETATECIYALAREIPYGKVTTYGQLGAMVGLTDMRTVGDAMNACPEDVPWQRVINSQGKISTDRLTLPHSLQQSILESEGVVFSGTGKCDLSVYQWHPEGFEPEADSQTKLFESD